MFIDHHQHEKSYHPTRFTGLRVFPSCFIKSRMTSQDSPMVSSFHWNSGRCSMIRRIVRSMWMLRFALRPKKYFICTGSSITQDNTQGQVTETLP